MEYIVRNMHFIFIHVPIAMLLFSFVFDIAAIFAKKKEWHSAGILCLVVGTMGAIASVLTGPEEERNPTFPRHELFGNISMYFFIALMLLRLWLHVGKKKEIGRHPVYLSAALIGVLLVSYTGHLGGTMVHPDRGQFGPGMQRPDFQGFDGEQGQPPSGNSRQNSPDNNGNQGTGSANQADG